MEYFWLGRLETNFSEISIGIHTLSFNKNPFQNVVKMAAIVSRYTSVHVAVFDLDNGLSPLPCHANYLNQCWIIMDYAIGKKCRWKFKKEPAVFSQEMHLEMSAAKWEPLCLGLNVLTNEFEWMKNSSVAVESLCTPSRLDELSKFVNFI